MSDSRLKQTFTTDDAKLLASYDKLLRKQQQVLDDTVRLATKSKDEAEKTRAALERQNDMLGKASSYITGLATSWLSVRGAVKLVNDEIERKIALDEKARQAQLTVADARAAFLRNAVALSPQERERAVARVQEISQQTGVDQRKLFTSAGSALSAAGDKSLDDVLAAVSAAARYVPGNSGEPEAVAGGLLDISSLTKSGDAIANLGVLSATQAKARVTTTEETARNLVPAAINVASYGDRPEEALSLVAAMTNAIKDYTGRQSGTSTIRLAQQLGEFFKPGEIRKEVTDALTEKPGGLGVAQTNPAIAQRLEDFLSAEGSLAKNGLRSGDAQSQAEFLKHNAEIAERFIQAEIQYRTGAGNVNTTAERIAFLQQHPDLAKSFFSRDEFSANFEAKPSKQIELLLTDVNSEIAKNFRGFQATIPGGDRARQVGEKALADVEGDKLVTQAQLARRLEATADQLLTGNLAAGEAGIMRDSLEKIFQATGMGSMQSKILKMESEFNTGFGTHEAADEVERQIVQRMLSLRYNAYGYGETGEGLYYPDFERGGAVPATQETQGGDLEKQAYALETDPESLRQADLLERTLGDLRAARAKREAEANATPAAPPPGLDVDRLQNLLAGGPTLTKMYKDEFELLRNAPTSEQELAGHAKDLDSLLREAEIQRQEALHPGAFLGGEATGQPERPQTPEDKATAAMLGVFIEEVKKLHASSVAVEQKLDAIKAENQTANRQAGARAARGSGKE